MPKVTGEDTSIFWFRRDLRLNDNAGLFYALKENVSVIPIFIFDSNILNQLEDKCDRRVDFIHRAVNSLKSQLQAFGSDLLAFYGEPLAVFQLLINDKNIKSVYANSDYEPYAMERDKKIETFLAAKNISFKTFKDQCVFEKNEITKDQGDPYTVFTPYSKKWKKTLNHFYYSAYNNRIYFKNFFITLPQPMISLNELGFKPTDVFFDEAILNRSWAIDKYKEARDYPALNGTSRLSVYLRFGVVSIRSLVAQSIGRSETWLNELIWRDFYMMILWHFPHAVKGAFKKDYDNITWRNNENEFYKWCEGRTGFPLVDAGIRELNATGFMHNRVRMVVSSFLIKNLLIDWRWGEAYFAKKLLDFDLSANNGGWQWAAGTGCDAAPYFRVFNPISQQQKFDPDFKYIKKWVPEYGTAEYPLPMVDLYYSRIRAIETYKKALADSRQMKLF